MQKSIKVPKRRAFLKEKGWNVVNPASEKPKFGRGTQAFKMKNNWDRKIEK